MGLDAVDPFEVGELMPTWHQRRRHVTRRVVQSSPEYAAMIENLDTNSGAPYERGPIFWHYPHYPNQGATPAAAVRDGDWKLVRFFEDDSMTLHHLGEDISEEHDRLDTEPDIGKRLRELLDGWLREVDARIPQPNPVAAYQDLPG